MAGQATPCARQPVVEEIELESTVHFEKLQIQLYGRSNRSARVHAKIEDARGMKLIMKLKRAA